MLFRQKFRISNTKNRIRRLPASPKALGIASFSLVGLCFGAAVYLAALPNLIAQSPAVSAVSDAGQMVTESAEDALQNTPEVAKARFASALLPVDDTAGMDVPAPTSVEEETPVAEGSQTQPAEDSKEDSTDTPAQTPKGDGADSSDLSPDMGLDDETEIKWRNYYTVSYNNLSTMVNSYNACISDANSLKYASYQERQAALMRCESLSDKLLDGFNYTLNSGIPDTSKYFSAKEPQVICYRSLAGALGSLIEMWKINLAYQDPAGHEDEFLKPILDDQVNGENKYISEFNRYYKSGCPSDE